jgi:hypothetical protein
MNNLSFFNWILLLSTIPLSILFIYAVREILRERRDMKEAGKRFRHLFGKV